MNKKGGYELADIAGFFLIFVLAALFGYLFIKSIPQTQVEILEVEHENYAARETLLKFLDYKMSTEESSAKIVDIIADNCVVDSSEKCWSIFPQFFLTKYALIIHKNKEFVSLSTNVDEVRVTLDKDEADKILKEIEETNDYQNYFVLFNNFNGDEVRIMLELFSENE